ncbi:PREDICTED: zinc finger CW-type PWWP domain protein 1-like [Papilio polytes]|uniref:zinc finger CW-type PWWP domain protein 1-like n=1 Tax=Papilio polytes TaxID=76194 RepID=UPI00067650DA|nr:PREDICTED: zinc finger CW-type PWWP domain protein 1-like [Papilio polytes]
MNPDKSLADCSAPEVRILLHDEEDLIHSRFSAGSIVWVKMAGWPSWPAMVDDCPDTEQFYWLDGFSDIPTDYHVVFFDKWEVSRAWVTDQMIEPFIVNNKSKIEDANRNSKYAKRLRVAVKQATDAFSLPLALRLKKYSFLARYKGKIVSPTKVSKTEIEKYRMSLKRKYNVDFPLSSDSDDNSDEDELVECKGKIDAANKRTDNAMGQKEKIKRNEKQPESDNNSDFSSTLNDEIKVNDTLKDMNSLKVNVTGTDDGLENAFPNNGLSIIDETKEINPDDAPINSQLQVRVASRSSDEFEF